MPSFLPHSIPRRFTDPIIYPLARLGVTPNLLTLVGVLGNVGAAVLVGRGQFLVGGILVLAFSALDLLDGALARASGRATRFGSVFDATMDRVSEAAILIGVLFFFANRGDATEATLAGLALAGSNLVSYVRARAEAIGVPLTEGLFTRAERVLAMGGGLVIASVVEQVLTVALWLLAVMANLTAAQRLYLVWRKTRSDEEEST